MGEPNRADYFFLLGFHSKLTTPDVQAFHLNHEDNEAFAEGVKAASNLPTSSKYLEHFQMSDSRTADKFVLRLPDGLRERYKEQAKANGRSMNSEMIKALEKGLEDDQRETELVTVITGLNTDTQLLRQTMSELTNELAALGRKMERRG